MSKKDKKNNYSFVGKNNSKKIVKNQAATGGTVAPKKHLNIFGGEKLGPIDSTLHHAVKADVGFVRKWGRKVEHAVKRENFFNSIGANGIGNAIGGVFSNASASIGGMISEHKARVELREDTYRRARKAAREVINDVYKPTRAEKAVMF